MSFSDVPPLRLILKKLKVITFKYFQKIRRFAAENSNSFFKGLVITFKFFQNRASLFFATFQFNQILIKFKGDHL